MATMKFYSDSEEFLMGIETGIEFTGDSALDSNGVSDSDNDKYAFMLVVSDSESNTDSERFYNGASLDYEEV